MIKAIFTDLDDTLIVNTVIYDDARQKLAGYLGNFGIAPAETFTAIDACDAEMFPLHGISRKRYPATYEAVVRKFMPEADPEIVQAARNIAEDVFDTYAPPKPGVALAVKDLSAHYPVYIVTAGDESVQKNRVASLPFRNNIAGVFIVPKKTETVFTDILTTLKLSADEAVMIGDSITSDILPALKAGLHAAHIQPEKSASYHPLNNKALPLPEGATQYETFPLAVKKMIADKMDAHKSRIKDSLQKRSAPGRGSPKTGPR